jgi:hypothetical protein
MLNTVQHGRNAYDLYSMVMICSTQSLMAKNSLSVNSVTP